MDRTYSESLASTIRGDDDDDDGQLIIHVNKVSDTMLI